MQFVQTLAQVPVTSDPQAQMRELGQSRVHPTATVKQAIDFVHDGAKDAQLGLSARQTKQRSPLGGCRVAGIFDADAERRQKAAAESRCPAYQTFAQLLDDGQTDAVVIATPSQSHAELCLAALAAGKHVFVEKPLAGTLSDAQRIADAAEKSDRVVQVGFCERFNVNHLEAKRAVDEGRLGTIRAMHTSRVAPYAMSDAAWELGVLDTAVHNLDLILWLIGRPPLTVLARAVNVYPDSPIRHSATILMMFEGGAMAVDHIAWLKDAGHPLNQCARSRMLIQGSDGAFECDLSDRPSALLTRDGYRKLDSVIVGGRGYAGCLKLQFEYFLRSIEEGLPVLAPVEDALAVEKLALAAAESLSTGAEIELK